MPKTPGKPRAQGAKPKQRWTTDQKQARDAARAPLGKAGKSARRGAEATDPRRARSADRTFGSRPERSPRPDRTEGASRYARPAQTERSSGFERTERTQSTQRSERPAWNDRQDRPASDRQSRGTRPAWGDRPARSERPAWGDRPARTERPVWEDRTSRPEGEFDRRAPRHAESEPGRPRWDDRAPRDRDDRPRRYVEADDRRRYQDGPDRRSHQAARPGDRPGRRPDQHARPEPDHMEWTARRHEKAAAEVRTGFSDLGLPEPLVTALATDGITEPFPIQAATIADALAGRDVLGRAKTGSGKTLGFGLPMLARLADEPGGLGVRGLVLVPTRELALQVADVLAPLAQSLGLSCALVAGGMAYGPQLRAFERGVDVVVATPGRLIDLMEQGAADLSQVAVTVLDEADHMADLGFWPAVTTIVDATPRDGQRLLFSATLDEAIDALVKRYLTDPVTHEVDPETASVGTMTHTFWVIAPHHKNELTARVAGRGGRTLVFVRTQLGADRVATQLRAAGVLAGALHGGLSQGARSRILAAFKEGTLPVLVATDVAARGIHVDDVSVVLQLDPPMTSKDYLHRSGRTARAGESGTVVSLVLPHQRRTVLRLAGQAGAKPQLVQVDPSAEAVVEVAGEWSDRAPIADEDFAALVAPKQTAPRRPRTPFRKFRGGDRR